MKKTLSIILIFGLIISISGISFAWDNTSRDSDDSGDDTAKSALGSAVIGGLLGAGLGAVIGSMSGRAGTGTAIGAGVGALGGTLVGASQARRSRAERAAEEYQEEAPPVQAQVPVQQQPAAVTKDMKVKKRIIREYDAEGNVVSEHEAAN